MALNEEELDQLEAAFPKLAGQAFSAARSRALAAGESVLQAEGGVIYRVSPDGQKVEVKKIKKPVKVTRGAKFLIK